MTDIVTRLVSVEATARGTAVEAARAVAPVQRALHVCALAAPLVFFLLGHFCPTDVLLAVQDLPLSSLFVPSCHGCRTAMSYAVPGVVAV